MLFIFLCLLARDQSSRRSPTRRSAACQCVGGIETLAIPMMACDDSVQSGLALADAVPAAIIAEMHGRAAMHVHEGPPPALIADGNPTWQAGGAVGKEEEEAMVE